MATAQGGLIALTLGQLVVDTVSLQRLLDELLAEFFMLDQRRVTVVFECRAKLDGSSALPQQAWALQIIAATRDTETRGELADDRVIRHQASVLLIRGCPQQGEAGLIVGEQQLMAMLAVLVVPRNPFLTAQPADEIEVTFSMVVPRNPFLTAQPADEIEVTFSVLRAVLPLYSAADMEGVHIGLDAVAVEHLGDNLRHRQVLEDAVVMAELQIVQRGH
ncbi:hypothetical protein AO391_25735 [Pseudomonas marginalis ICMP 9505]|nr:hypothetical protein AO391_25735 [Pseudomonas marginalis ICMP 9505]